MEGGQGRSGGAANTRTGEERRLEKKMNTAQERRLNLRRHGTRKCLAWKSLGAACKFIRGAGRAAKDAVRPLLSIRSYISGRGRGVEVGG